MKSVKVADYMARNLVTFEPGTSVVEALSTLLDKRISGAPVIDSDGTLVGMLSEVDLIQVFIQDSYYDENAGIVGDYMHAPVETVTPDMDIYSLAEQFRKARRRRYPVVKNGKLVGQISRRDVLRAARDLMSKRSG